MSHRRLPAYHAPQPGPLYWSYRCLKCSRPVRHHAPAWERALMRATVIRRLRAARKSASVASTPWHIGDVPVHDPDTNELIGWVATRSDTGEALPEWIERQHRG